MFTFSQISLIMRLKLKASPSIFRLFEFVVLVEVAEDIWPHRDDIVGKGIVFVAFSDSCEFNCVQH